MASSLLHQAACTFLRGSTPLAQTQNYHHRIRRPSGPQPIHAFFGWNERSDREEQKRIQAEVLAERKTGAGIKRQLAARQEVRKYLRDPEYKKSIDAEKRKRNAEIAAKADPIPKFGIIIPLAPFGIPDYDQGERFDLAGDFVDEGWVDEDADFFQKVKGFFGGGKKKSGGEK